MTIVENLDRIKEIKEQIKQSISNKGVDMNGVPFYDYPDKISEIKDSEIVPAKVMVADAKINLSYSKFTEIPTPFDFTGLTDFREMFANCENLKAVRPIEWADAINADYCFTYCTHIELGDNRINPYLIEAPNLTSAMYMFDNITDYNENGRYLTLDVYNEDKEAINLSFAFNYSDFDSLTIKANGEINAHSIFSKAKIFNLTLDGDWSNAIFTDYSFDGLMVGGFKVSSETKFHKTNLNFSNVYNADSYYDCLDVNDALSIIRNNLGQARNGQYIKFYDRQHKIEDALTEEDIANATSKNWSIEFDY